MATIQWFGILLFALVSATLLMAIIALLFDGPRDSKLVNWITGCLWVVTTIMSMAGRLLTGKPEGWSLPSLLPIVGAGFLAIVFIVRAARYAPNR
ncbi:MAG: hypothetical protein WC400_02885 [Patescibacteria group bacterium]|jgi:hypothetical protein